MVQTAHEALASIARSPKLFVAWIAGHALGGGLEIALACDIRLAATGGYKMGLPEVTLGILPGNGGTQRLTRLIGPSRSLELLLTGRTFSPEDAHQMGLLAHVYDADSADASVREYAERLAAGPALALAAIKRCVHEGGQKSLDDGLKLEAELMENLFRTKDADEGLHAFAEKRKAEFVGA
jgi:enoyl-CoA hydratase/carnithine racemase